jgi:hypothetical protein
MGHHHLRAATDVLELDANLGRHGMPGGRAGVRRRCQSDRLRAPAHRGQQAHRRVRILGDRHGRADDPGLAPALGHVG